MSSTNPNTSELGSELMKFESEQSKVHVTQRLGYRRLPAFQLRDLLYCVVLPFLGIIAWIFPERWWPNLCHGLVHAFMLGPNLLGGTLLERVRAAAGTTDLPVNHQDICVAYVANKLLLQLQYYRSLRPGGWRARLTLDGRERLDAALQCKRGVILWSRRQHQRSS